MQLQTKNLMWVTVVLLAVAVTDAAPTIGRSGMDISWSVVSLNSDNHVPDVTHAVQIINFRDCPLAASAADFLNPPTDFASPAGPLSANAKTLPAVPGAILMVLAGFLCISVVRDRRVWMAAAAGLLWAGQVSLRAIPQLTLHLGPRTHHGQNACAGPSYHYVSGCSRPHHDVGDTKHVGLLRRLADIAVGQVMPRHGQANMAAPLWATLTEQDRLNTSAICLASRAREFICFSPAFIFDNLARGPPAPARV